MPLATIILMLFCLVLLAAAVMGGPGKYIGPAVLALAVVILLLALKVV